MAADRKQQPATVLCVVGARPNFMKIAPIMRAIEPVPCLDAHLVHTGQHYDEDMSASFFSDLGIPPPDRNLEVGSSSHAQQTAEIMTRFEPVLDSVAPACVLVVGDVNSTIACALVAIKKSVPVAHVEAGLRSYDRSMPEEINRVLTDQISDLLFTTECTALDNLVKEGVSAKRVHFVGNTMIDTLLKNLERAKPPEQTLSAAGVPRATLDDPRGYGVITLHRPSNVDDPAVLRGLLETLSDISGRCPLLFPLHPRTRTRIEESGLQHMFENQELYPLAPVGYLEMLGLMADARAVFTDSGGIQEETTALGVPCFTIRENTERPITIHEGTNTLVGTAPENILAAFRDLEETGGKTGRVPALWDGKAAQRIVEILARELGPVRAPTPAV
jgi:UDP-N-acetylglucosamine 2-epimerase (non-hydrolysing)